MAQIIDYQICTCIARQTRRQQIFGLKSHIISRQLAEWLGRTTIGSRDPWSDELLRHLNPDRAGPIIKHVGYQ